MEHIFQEIFKSISFTQNEIKILDSKFKKKVLKKGTIIQEAGKTVLYTHYVQSGCLRTYFVDNSGKEHTLQFAIKDWWISDYTAFFEGGKAMMSIECIQDTLLYQLSRKDMLQLYLQVPKLESYFRQKLEKRMTAFHKRTLGNLALSAKERYLSFIETYPNIEQKVRNYHIASYLGITTESLSRVRKEIAL